MVPKEALSQLFADKVEAPLNQIKDNHVNIENYLSKVRVWFAEYKKDEIERSGFERFLKHLESKTIEVMYDVKDKVKPKIIDAVNTFLEEIESHASEEVTDEIESVIKNIGGDVGSISKNNNMIKMNKGWRVSIFIMIMFIVLAGGIYYMVFYLPSGSLEDQSVNVSSSNKTDKNETQNLASNSTGDNVEVIPEDVPSNIPQIEDAFEIAENKEAILTPIEKEVFNLINSQRESYYLNKFELDDNYTALLKEDVEDISEQLEIEAFIFELDEELALKGDDIPLAIYNQMNKHNLFNDDLSKIAISINKVKYKLYRVQLAFY